MADEPGNRAPDEVVEERDKPRPSRLQTPGGIDLSLRTFLRRLGEELFHLDAKVWRSLATLLRQPGKLSKLVIDGKGTDYVHPVRAYLVVNLLFFLLVPWLNSDRGTIWHFTHDTLASFSPLYADLIASGPETIGVSEKAYGMLFDAQILSLQGAFVAVVIPIFALQLWAVFHRRRRFLAEHLLFATAMLTVFLGYLMFIGILARLLQAASPGNWVGIAIAILAAWWLFEVFRWLLRGSRTFYGLTRRGSWLAVWLLWVFFGVAYYVYLHLIFWAAYFGIG